MRITARTGDITTCDVDAVVNAANSTLLGGGGVDGAIHAAAGPALLEECRRVRASRWHDGLPPGEAVETGAGHLPARWVIHTVGPDARRGQTDPAVLASCFTRSLDVAARIGARSVAFPAVSAGVFGWDPAVVAEVAVAAVREWGERAGGTPEGGAGAETVEEVIFVLFSDAVRAEFDRALEAIP